MDEPNQEQVTQEKCRIQDRASHGRKWLKETELEQGRKIGPIDPKGLCQEDEHANATLPVRWIALADSIEAGSLF